MPHYPVDLGHDRTLYERVESILSGRELDVSISPSIMDKCCGSRWGLDSLDAEYEKSLIKLISHYDVVFPQNKEKPFNKEHKYWVTNWQFVALFWECLKFIDKDMVTRWYQEYIHEKMEQNLRNKNDRYKLNQVLRKDLIQVNYVELITAGVQDRNGLSGSHGVVYTHAHRILRRLDKKGIVIRERETQDSDRTYLRIRPTFIINQTTL